MLQIFKRNISESIYFVLQYEKKDEIIKWIVNTWLPKRLKNTIDICTNNVVFTSREN